MFQEQRWRNLGWEHPLWELVRYYHSLGVKRDAWLKELSQHKSFVVDQQHTFLVKESHIELLSEYALFREKQLCLAESFLRDEQEALLFCERNGIEVGTTSTQNKTHHQSSNSLVRTVTHFAKKLCEQKQLDLNSNPQGRCVWQKDNYFHVTARNVDGAISSLGNPKVVWEIKEYWGKTKGGSKMSDAVYECTLVGRELREFEKKSQEKIYHIVFLDGKLQWSYRRADLGRFLDLMNQNIVDYLLIGKEVESEWETLLQKIL